MPGCVDTMDIRRDVYMRVSFTHTCTPRKLLSAIQPSSASHLAVTPAVQSQQSASQLLPTALDAAWRRLLSHAARQVSMYWAVPRECALKLRRGQKRLLRRQKLRLVDASRMDKASESER